MLLISRMAQDKETQPVVAHANESQLLGAAAHVPRSPPNGGIQAWLVVSGAFCALICTFGYLNSFGYACEIRYPLLKANRNHGIEYSSLIINLDFSPKSPLATYHGSVHYRFSSFFLEVYCPGHWRIDMASRQANL